MRDVDATLGATPVSRPEPRSRRVPHSSSDTHERATPSRSHATIAPPPAQEQGYLRMISTILSNRIMVARLALLGAVIAIAATLIGGRDYSSDFSFTPIDANSNGISAIASGIGLNMGGGGPQSPQFYADLTTSRQILGTLLDQRYTVRGDTGMETGTLAELLTDGSRDKAAVRKTKALKMLRLMVSARPDLKTGLVSVGIRSKSPEFSQQLATNLLAELNKFNVDSRRADNVAEAEFAKLRMEQAADSLRRAEDVRQKFAERNRYYNNSPELQREQVRLDREVSLLTGTYNQDVLSYEHARMEAMRKTPVITIVDRPEIAALPDARGLIAKTILGGMLGALLAVMIAFVRTTLVRGHTAANPLAEYAMLRDAAIADLRNPATALRELVFLGKGKRERAA